MYMRGKDNLIPCCFQLKSGAREMRASENWENSPLAIVGVIFSGLQQISRRFRNIGTGEFSPWWDIAPREIARERLDDVLRDDEHTGYKREFCNTNQPVAKAPRYANLTTQRKTTCPRMLRYLIGAFQNRTKVQHLVWEKKIWKKLCFALQRIFRKIFCYVFLEW